MELCVLVAIGIVGTILVLPIRSAILGWKTREIWGEVLDRHELAGQGAFRTAAVQSTKPRGVPALVWAAGVSGAALAPWTGLVLAPAGLLGGLIFADDRTPLVAVTTFAGSVSGFVLPIFLYRASRALLTCEWDAAVSARRAGLWSAGHHGLLMGAFAAELLVGGDSDFAWAVGLSAVGLVHAALMLAAGRHVAAIQGELTQQAVEEARVSVLPITQPPAAPVEPAVFEPPPDEHS